MGFMDEYNKLKKKRNEDEEEKDIAPVLTKPDLIKSADAEGIKEKTEEKRSWFQSILGSAKETADSLDSYIYRYGDNKEKSSNSNVTDNSETVANEDDEGSFWKWLGNASMSGLNSFNKGVTSTIDVILGKPLQALGWKDNPISSAADYYSNLYNAYKEETNSQSEKLGGGTGYEVGGTLIEGTVATLPNAILALMTAGTSAVGSAATTTSSLATTAAYQSGNILTKAGITTQTMAQNPQFWTSFAQTYGTDYEEAIEAGADETTAAFGATISSLVNAGIEIGTGGDSGIQGLPQKVAEGGKSAILEWVESSLEEGGEEVLQGVVTNAVSKILYDGDTKVFDTGEMIQNFGMGTAIGGIVGGGQIAVQGMTNAVSNAVQNYEASKLTDNEQKVVDKVYTDRIAEAEESGKKLSQKEKFKIYDEVLDQMNKGYISTDTIEEVLGGETYKSYKDTIDSEDSVLKEYEELINLKKSDLTVKQDNRIKELEQQIAEFTNADTRNKLKSQLGSEVSEMVKWDRLGESYNERGRRSQAFEADLTKYDAKQQEVIKKAVDSGILNNTNRTHEFVDMVAKISADKGVLFDFTNNAKLKESGFAIDGKSVNGYVTKDGVTVNIQSSKSLNSVVGHEITHVLEGTEFYAELQTALFDYAKSKNDYQGRHDALMKLYENVEGANIDAELTADLVGDYLFTDSDFVNNLSTNHRNVFQKIYDEIKYLCKVVTAGSKEARELEKVKKAFDKAYRDSGKQNTEAKSDNASARYSVSEIDPYSLDPVNGVTDKQMFDYLVEQFENKGYDGRPIVAIGSEGEQGIALTGSHRIFAAREAGIDVPVAYIPYDADNPLIAELAESSSDEERANIARQLFEEGTISKDVYDLIQREDDLNNENYGVPYESQTRYSISDSDGNQLSEKQQEFFKDSKVRDDNGNLKVMYHGTSRGGHTVFDPWGMSNYGLFGTGSYFTDSKTIGESYTKKGKGKNPQVYEVYLNIKNPLDMDAAADPAQWAKAFPDADFPQSGTNEDFYRAVEEYYADQYMPKWEVAEEIQATIESGMGYDGITHIGGGRVNTNGERHQVYIAFQPEQIKNIDNTKPTSDPDIRYSLNNEDQENGNVMVLDGDSVAKYSLSTWTSETQANVKNNLIKAGFDAGRVDKWIKDTNSVASVIASDKERLDFVAADNQTMLKNNQEYVKTLDASTLCAKRLAYQGTFDAIQHRMPDTMLSSDDLIDLLNMMKEHGVQTPCGVCYVESRRRHLGKFAQEWLDGYNGEYKPHLDEVTTSDGLEALRMSHPDTYEDFMTAMKKKGSANPKVVQLRTEYRNEIMSLTPAQIRKIEAIGGLRVQSFSDFETPHLLDMMQAVMDMSAKGLSSQAYTKVPNFAWVFGDTGIKINLSLIADGDGFDSNGNLAFSSIEGMNFDDAMELRNAYPENVGTIIVGANDEHILACMADDRIDFIIPFHRSGWGQNELEMMGMSSYKDYTYGQNEHDLKTGKGVANLYPPDYWDYNLTGKENAERYLNLCAKTGREPKFSQFLVNNGDGSYSLQSDGSTDGYWKTLIDFKMYDNNGNGAPQKKVLPNFNMEEAYRVLNDYEGGANKLPVANEVVEEFVAKYKEKNIAPVHSLSNVGESQKTYGNYNVYGKDVALESAPIREAAPMQKTVAETATTEDVLPDDFAPPVKATEDEIAPVSAADEDAMTEGVAPTTEVKSGEKAWDTEVLVDEPKVQKKKNRAWSKFKANFLDKGAVFEDLSIKTKNRELMGKWNYILSSESRAQRMIGNGSKTDGVKSLNDIREEVENSGQTKQFYEYLYHKHNVDRMQLADRYKDTPNKPVFGDSVTAEASQEIVDQYEFAEPKFKEYAEDVYSYMNHLRKLMVDNGVISQETADLWSEMYPHYVPIRRAGDNGLNINVPLDSRKTGVNAPIKKATGGSRNILPLFDTMAMRTQQTYKAIAKNNFGVELKNTLGTAIANEAASVDEVIDSVDTQDSLLQEGKNGQNPTFTVFENGEKVTFEITEDMYDALKPTSEGLAYTNKIARTISNIHRGVLTEYNPVFMATNAIKDAQDVLVNSQHPAKTYAQLPKAAMEIIKKGSWYNEYLDNGGEQNTYFDKETNTFEKEKSAVRKVVGMPLDLISSLNNGIEMMPRLAEYMASRKAGQSVEVSMLDAARVTTNFAAGGDVTKFLNRNGATFLNASVQGAMQQVRNVREAKMNGLKGWVNLAAKFAVAGLPAVLLNYLLWNDDEEYEELSDYVKQNYYVVAKYDDGKFVRIPKGRTLAVIQNAFEQVSNAITGDDEVDLASFLDLAVSNLAPNNPLDNNILSPIIQVANNETWYGDDLVPTRLQDLPQAEQFDEGTDSISKWLGEKLNYSPYKINYLLNQYSGGVGDVLLPMLTTEAESGDDSFVGNMIAPLKDKFTTDSVMNNQNVSDFYDTVDELTTNAKTSTATDEDVLKYKYISSINAELSELYAQKREIQNSSLADDKKYSQVREVQQQIVNLMKEGLNSYNDVFTSDTYATVADRHYRLNQDGEWQKVTDKQLEKQEEVTSELGISASDYWGNKDEYDYAYEYPEKYAVAKSVGGYDAYKTYSNDLYDIKANKDANGKSISGSRKEKVIEYINNMDADYGEKIVLFKSEYPSDDTYNYEIIDYLNGRDDISYEEMETILKELGFTVSSDGTITW